ncbi:MAG TPA: tRNA (guanosine(46)-N7)-methyltransferase TrmB [Gemmataceae bacterium]|nr:tRNA (guanosine(46)-N7)-methyltransferase TrmB [Gemmataceae bacterium]
MRRASRLSAEVLAPYLFQVTDPPTPLDWLSLFGNDHPVEIEIGFGKGLFILTSALANSAVNYLGVEIERKLQLFTANRIAKRELHNVRLIKADGRLFLRDYVKSESVQAVHVYFPDPWWKQRHRKRRLFTSEFADQCIRVLRPGGHLHLATDVDEYFEVMAALLAKQERLDRVSLVKSELPSQESEFQTNFERKSIIQGRSVNRAVYRRKA